MIHHQPDPVRRRAVDTDPQLHLLGEVLLSALRRDIAVTPSS
jgi:hypothetical protein